MMIKAGFRYRAVADAPLLCLTHWAKPITGVHEVMLPKGETVTVWQEPPSFAEAIHVRPERYGHFLLRFVPEAERADDGFSEYSLSVTPDQLASLFVRIA
jgi:hypothetical protein